MGANENEIKVWIARDADDDLFMYFHEPVYFAHHDDDESSIDYFWASEPNDGFSIDNYCLYFILPGECWEFTLGQSNGKKIQCKKASG